MQDIMVIAPGEGKSVAIGPTRTTFMMRSEQTDGRFSLVEHALPPQFSGPPPHVHRQYDHAWYVVEGEVQLTFGDRIVEARAGTFVFVPKGIAHTFSNPGTAWTRMLEIDASGGFEPYFEELAAAFPEGTSVNPSVVVAIQRKYDTYPPTPEQKGPVQ
jgi:mannose-6-phosphate isomerase-like protein (cupin superfamily)